MEIEKGERERECYRWFDVGMKVAKESKADICHRSMYVAGQE